MSPAQGLTRPGLTPAPDRVLNLGVLAHVDAGKTSLTERLLYAGGAIARLGSVDGGDTHTDTLEQERARGITIRSAVASFRVDQARINLIDTPGHPDFIAEVERVLAVLDAAVLVVSAVEGLQPQTRVLMRTLRRLGLPTVLFVNKIDRAGAQDEALLAAIRTELTPSLAPLGRVVGAGRADAEFRPYADGDPALAEMLYEVLGVHDDEVLGAYLGERPRLGPTALRARLLRLAQAGRVCPLIFGSAITGAGVADLMVLLSQMAAPPPPSDGPPAGLVFKVERDARGARVAHVRMFGGVLRARDQVQFGRSGNAKVTAVLPFGADEVPGVVSAGQIARVVGLGGVMIGDAVGAAGEAAPNTRNFPPPSLETVIAPVRPEERGALLAALAELAEQDPLINLRQDDVRREIYISLYGEVQKEVIGETLAAQYGLGVAFRDTTVVCVERVAGDGAAVEFLEKGHNPFLATIGLRVEPLPEGAGIQFDLEVELGCIPLAFHRAIEESARRTLQQGLRGWPVVDCRVVLTHAGYLARQSHSHATFDKSMSSTAGDFRNLTPLVLMEALRQAGSQVCEPVHGFRLSTPSGLVGRLLTILPRFQAISLSQEHLGGSTVLEGEIPATEIHPLQQRLPTLTAGDGYMETFFLRYRSASGPPPVRARTDHDPTDRRLYLLNLRRQQEGGDARSA